VLREDGPSSALPPWGEDRPGRLWGRIGFFSREGRVVTTLPQVGVETPRKVRRLPVTFPHSSTGAGTAGDDRAGPGGLPEAGRLGSYRGFTRPELHDGARWWASLDGRSGHGRVPHSCPKRPKSAVSSHAEPRLDNPLAACVHVGSGRFSRIGAYPPNHPFKVVARVRIPLGASAIAWLVQTRMAARVRSGRCMWCLPGGLPRISSRLATQPLELVGEETKQQAGG